MNNRPLIIAHRGESNIAPENSMASIQLAWKNNAKAVEIDVHLTLDNQIVVIHDRHTGRVGDRRLYIAKTALQSLKKVDIGKKKAEEFEGEKISSLNEVLETVPANAKIIIEIKCGEEILMPLVEKLKNTKLKINQIEIIAFDLKLLASIKKQLPQFKALWLLNLDYHWPSWVLKVDSKKIWEKVQMNNLDGVNVWAGKTINKDFVNDFKSKGLLVYTWTVNDLLNANRMIAYGVDAITTDRAAWLKQQLAGIKQ